MACLLVNYIHPTCTPPGTAPSPQMCAGHVLSCAKYQKYKRMNRHAAHAALPTTTSCVNFGSRLIFHALLFFSGLQRRVRQHGVLYTLRHRPVEHLGAWHLGRPQPFARIPAVFHVLISLPIWCWEIVRRRADLPQRRWRRNLRERVCRAELGVQQSLPEHAVDRQLLPACVQRRCRRVHVAPHADGAWKWTDRSSSHPSSPRLPCHAGRR